jgi:hypothetical protein
MELVGIEPTTSRLPVPSNRIIPIVMNSYQMRKSHSRTAS